MDDKAPATGEASVANGRGAAAVPMARAAGFKLKDGRPDVRGWPVISADGKQIGTVADLLVDPAAGRIRYLDVDLDDTLLVENPERHVLVPVGCAHVDAAGHVLTDALHARDLPMLAPYEGALTPELEAGIRAAFTHMRGEVPQPLSETDDPYAGSEFDEDRFFDPPPPAALAPSADRATAGATRTALASDAPAPAVRTLASAGDEGRLTLSAEELEISRREVEAGAVQVHKRVETRHVEQTVPTTREEVVIERRPVPEGSTPKARIEGDDVIIPLYEEELVIQKRMVAREELVVRKRRVTVDQVVEADLRREHADIEREGDVHVRGDTAGDPPSRSRDDAP